jgi:hypothetical protein
VVHDGDRDGPKVIVVEGLAGVGTLQAALKLAHRRSNEYPDIRKYIRRVVVDTPFKV